MRKVILVASNFVPSLMRVFLAFQIEYAEAMSPILRAFCTMAEHVLFVVVLLLIPVQSRISSQTVFVSEHLKKRCSIVSSSFMQRAHLLSISVHVTRSLVVSLSLRASQQMKECFGGKGSFQTNFAQNRRPPHGLNHS